jgi:hypothetical protein
MSESGSELVAAASSSSSRTAAENANNIDIFFLRYSIIFSKKILLQYSLELFNDFSLGSVSLTSRIYYEPIK